MCCRAQACVFCAYIYLYNTHASIRNVSIDMYGCKVCQTRKQFVLAIRQGCQSRHSTSTPALGGGATDDGQGQQSAPHQLQGSMIVGFRSGKGCTCPVNSLSPCRLCYGDLTSPAFSVLSHRPTCVSLCVLHRTM